MITAWDVYWITRLDILQGIFAVCALVSFGCLVFSGIYRTIFAPMLAIFIILVTLIPSTKEACAIYLIPKIANNEQVQKIPDNFAKLFNVKMEEWIKDTISDEKEKK